MEPKRLAHRALTKGSSLKPSRRKGLTARYLPLVCIVVFLGLQPRLAVTEELSAKEIVRRMTSISDMAKDGTSRARMVLIDSKGAKIDRTVTTYRLTLENGSKSLIVFSAPSDVKGTALLVWSYEDKDDEQWLYLPAYERVRRITSSGKGEGFVGSDLSFSDLEERGLEEFRYSKGPDVNEGGFDCYAIEAVPNDKGYPYAKIRYAIDKKTFLPVKIELFDWDNASKAFKIATCRDFREVDGIPTIFFMEMHNIKTNHKTQLILEEARYNTGLKEDLFTQRYLRRGGP